MLSWCWIRRTLDSKARDASIISIISVVGFTPDFFFGAVTGRILDRTPGIGGFHDYFLFLAGVAAVGLLVVVWLLRQRRRGGDPWRTKKNRKKDNRTGNAAEIA